MLDNWTEGGALDSRCPYLAALDSKKSCTMAERISTDSFTWKWKRRPMLPDEQQELQHLIAIISNFPLSDTEDPWRSKLDANGHFYVCKLRYLINPKLTISASNPTIWSVPLKVTSFIWRACMDRIPFSLAVIPHGVNITSSSCALCPNEFDSCDHLLVSGPYIR